VSSKKNIALFGGSFDPIHDGHTTIAQAAVEKLKLDEVRFIPCKQSPHKQGRKLADEKHRLKMVEFATKNLSWAKVDDYELHAPPPSYSWKTVAYMQEHFPDAKLFWLMGTDQWKALPLWAKPEYLASTLDFIVYTRAEHPEPRDGFRMHSISGDHPASSTLIRSGEAPAKWLHSDVAEYIKKESLYKL